MSATKKKEQPYTSQLRGVAALLESTTNDNAVTDKAAELVPLKQVITASSQPRRYFDPHQQKQLEASISIHGILEPVLVRPLESGQYELVAGERRYLAAKAVGLSHLPVVIKQLSDTQSLEIALIENLQRADLNPLEETEGILELLSLKTELTRDEVVLWLYRLENESKGKVTQNVLGKDTNEKILGLFDSLGRMSWSSFVSSRLPLLKLPPDILEALRQGKIAYTKASAIARVKDEDARTQLLEKASANSLSLSQIRSLIKELKPAKQQEALKTRWDNTSKQIKKAKNLWSNAKKRKQLESLLAKLEKLIES